MSALFELHVGAACLIWTRIVQRVTFLPTVVKLEKVFYFTLLKMGKNNKWLEVV